LVLIDIKGLLAEHTGMHRRGDVTARMVASTLLNRIGPIATPAKCPP